MARWHAAKVASGSAGHAIQSQLCTVTARDWIPSSSELEQPKHGADQAAAAPAPIHSARSEEHCSPWTAVARARLRRSRVVTRKRNDRLAASAAVTLARTTAVRSSAARPDRSRRTRWRNVPADLSAAQYRAAGRSNGEGRKLMVSIQRFSDWLSRLRSRREVHVVQRGVQLRARSGAYA